MRATRHADRESDQPRNGRDRGPTGWVVGANLQELEGCSAERAVTRGIDTDRGDLGFWGYGGGLVGHVVDVSGGVSTQEIENITEVDHVHVEVLRSGLWRG